MILTFLVHGGYTEWEPWQQCNVTCGDGVKQRLRSCSNPTPQYGGKTCAEQSLGDAIDSKGCSPKPCEGMENSIHRTWILLT